MARNTMQLNFAGFTEYVKELEGLGGEVKKVVDKALTEVGETVGRDTKAAVQKTNLPARGQFSTGETSKTVIEDPKVSWSGTVASIGVGFDFGQKGAGGYLIGGYYQNYHGTPRHMEPDRKLNEMYKKKHYQRDLENRMIKIVNEEIDRRLPK